MSDRGDVSELPAGRTAPVVKTHYTAEEFRALLEDLPPPTDDDRTILRGFDRPATDDELRAFAEELWAIYRAEQEAG